MANKYTHSKTPNAFKQGRRNNRMKTTNIVVGGKRQLGANWGSFCSPWGKTYDGTKGVIGKNYRAASVA